MDCQRGIDECVCREFKKIYEVTDGLVTGTGISGVVNIHWWGVWRLASVGEKRKLIWPCEFMTTESALLKDNHYFSIFWN